MTMSGASSFARCLVLCATVYATLFHQRECVRIGELCTKGKDYKHMCSLLSLETIPATAQVGRASASLLPQSSKQIQRPNLPITSHHLFHLYTYRLLCSSARDISSHSRQTSNPSLSASPRLSETQPSRNRIACL